MNRHTPRLRALLVALAAASLLATACGTGRSADKWDAQSVGESIQDAPFTPMIVNSNIGRGPTRLALALLKQDQTLVLEGEVTARIVRLDTDTQPEPVAAETLGTFPFTARMIDIADHSQEHPPQPGRGMRMDTDDRGRTLVDVALRDATAGVDVASTPAHDGALSTIFTAMVDFKAAGMYGADLEVKTGGETYRHLQLTFAVLEQTSEPSVGDIVPKSKQKLASDVSDLTEIDSAAKPNPELHDITIADAIASGQPSVVAFVTPAFCQTRFCGPVLENVVLPLHQQYGSRAHVMHIEPFDLPTARKGQLVAVPTVQEWNLRSEPFIAIVDGQGRLTAKFEGIIDLAEVREALEAVLAGR